MKIAMELLDVSEDGGEAEPYIAGLSSLSPKPCTVDLDLFISQLLSYKDHPGKEVCSIIFAIILFIALCSCFQFLEWVSKIHYLQSLTSLYLITPYK